MKRIPFWPPFLADDSLSHAPRKSRKSTHAAGVTENNKSQDITRYLKNLFTSSSWLYTVKVLTPPFFRSRPKCSLHPSIPFSRVRVCKNLSFHHGKHLVSKSAHPFAPFFPRAVCYPGDVRPPRLPPSMLSAIAQHQTTESLRPAATDRGSLMPPPIACTPTTQPPHYLLSAF